MSDGQEPELTYNGQDDSFDTARGATKRFENELPEESKALMCSCCEGERRGKRFLALVEEDGRNTGYARS
eukprot:3107826-Prorocentrum_lima.AAC.1